MSILGKNIKFFRKQESMTQEQLAKLLKLDRTTVVGYESGKHEPSLSILIAIADIFDTSVDELLGRKEGY